jgi:hypothetical protein
VFASLPLGSHGLKFQSFRFLFAILFIRNTTVLKNAKFAFSSLMSFQSSCSNRSGQFGFLRMFRSSLAQYARIIMIIMIIVIVTMVIVVAVVGIGVDITSSLGKAR